MLCNHLQRTINSYIFRRIFYDLCHWNLAKFVYDLDIQKGRIKIGSYLIFQKSFINSDSKHTLPSWPTSPLSRGIPLRLYSSMCRLTALDGLLTGTVIGASEDQMFTISNMKKARGESSTVGEGGLEWAAWVQFLGPTEEVKHYHFLKTLLEVFAKNLEAECRLVPYHVLSLEYKSPIPDTDTISKRTVGIYSRCTFMLGGRHDVYVEIWSAPSNIGEGYEIEGWKEKQVCLAISNQMALSVPPGVNERKSTTEAQL